MKIYLSVAEWNSFGIGTSETRIVYVGLSETNAIRSIHSFFASEELKNRVYKYGDCAYLEIWNDEKYIETRRIDLENIDYE